MCKKLVKVKFIYSNTQKLYITIRKQFSFSQLESSLRQKKISAINVEESIRKYINKKNHNAFPNSFPFSQQE